MALFKKKASAQEVGEAYLAFLMQTSTTSLSQHLPAAKERGEVTYSKEGIDKKIEDYIGLWTECVLEIMTAIGAPKPASKIAQAARNVWDQNKVRNKHEVAIPDELRLLLLDPTVFENPRSWPAIISFIVGLSLDGEISSVSVKDMYIVYMQSDLGMCLRYAVYLSQNYKLT